MVLYAPVFENLAGAFLCFFCFRVSGIIDTSFTDFIGCFVDIRCQFE